MVISINEAFIILWDKYSRHPLPDMKRYDRLMNKLISWELYQNEVDHGE